MAESQTKYMFSVTDRISNFGDVKSQLKDGDEHHSLTFILYSLFDCAFFK